MLTQNQRNLILILVVVVILLYMRNDTCKKSSSNNTKSKFISDDSLNKEGYGFKNYNDYSHVNEMDFQKTRYNSEPLWNEVFGKILTIVGGDSAGDFQVGNKIRLNQQERTWHGTINYDDIPPHYNRSNMPFVYIETSRDAKEWKMHPIYSAPADAVAFENYNVFTLQTPGGYMRFIRYPNGRLWVGNEDGEGDLRTLEMTDLKIPFLENEDPEIGANETSSALKSTN